MFVKIVEIATYILPRRLLPLLPRISSRLVCRRWGQVRLHRPHLLRRHRPFQRRSSAFWPTLFSVTLPCWPLSPLSGKKNTGPSNKSGSRVSPSILVILFKSITGTTVCLSSITAATLALISQLPFSTAAVTLYYSFLKGKRMF